VTLTFSFSGDPALSTLTAALAVSPALTTLRIPSPRCGLLRTPSSNPALRRICLGVRCFFLSFYSFSLSFLSVFLYLCSARMRPANSSRQARTSTAPRLFPLPRTETRYPPHHALPVRRALPRAPL
jgi:hypothetical protein